MYTVLTKDIEVKSISLSEVLRYMGAGECPDAQAILAAERAAKMVIDASSCRACYTRVPLEWISDSEVKLSHILLYSRDISRWLKGCSEAFVIGVSAGVGVDRVIRQSLSDSALLSLACDAAGSALVEQACDELDEFLAETVRSLGGDTCVRFSPGYGDLSLEYQRQITDLLNTSKNIGASLTQGVMMAPSKTVTAIIGIKKQS